MKDIKLPSGSIRRISEDVDRDLNFACWVSIISMLVVTIVGPLLTAIYFAHFGGTWPLPR